jgi:glycosyltransferase involved in cell wall biosynthesis
MGPVAAFTDTYLPTVNGVTYTIQTWRKRFQDRGGRMDVVYPNARDYDPEPGEHPVRSVPFPFYEGFRVGVPRVPDAVRDAEVVHAHTPFALGLSGLRLASRSDRAFVASYHTPTAEYADYITERPRVERAIRNVSRSYERWFFGRAAVVLVPSETTRRHLLEDVGVDTEVRVLSNGVDVDRFRPTDGESFRDRYDLPSGPLVGYTGRHGYEKRLSDVLRAVDGLDVSVVFGGDGPARDDLERLASDLDVDATFLGFLDREELPAFYSALDAFAFPSPVETQGLVALEAIACGTPVVGVDAGALANTVDDGRTGYHFPAGDADGFRAAIRRTLDERDRLRERCLARRESISVEQSIDQLTRIYERVSTRR